jgi:thioredoxin-dependent peroxiredoxin
VTEVVQEGQPAPDFELTSDAGEAVRLADLRGKRVVLYFYPRDATSGCTKQACGIRDAWGSFRETGAEVFGISPDGEASHARFKNEYSLPFTLLVDSDHEVTARYGFWVEKSFADKKHMGVERSTVVIGEDGTVEKVFRRVKPDDHAALVLDALR